MKTAVLLIAILFSLSGCISTVVGTAVDITTAVVKVPFQVGGAIIDGVSGDDDDEEESKD